MLMKSTPGHIHKVREKQLTSNTGTSKKNGNIKSMLSKFENWNGPETDPPWGEVGGWGWGVTADDDRGCYDPIDPVWPPHLTHRLTLSSMLFNIEFDVTVFDVPVFDVTTLYLRYTFPLH